MDYLRIGIELFVGYVALLILTKILGKTQITQLTPFDFISALILGELVGNALFDDHIGLTKILFAIVLWALLIYTTEIITQKYKKSRKFLEGAPSIVIHKGQIDYESLKKNKLDLNQLQLLLRAQGVFSIKECEYAVLETNGTVSVLKKPEFGTPTRKDLNIKSEKQTLPVTLILDGKIMKDHLKLINWSEGTLIQQLKKNGANSVHEVLYAEWKENEPLFIQKYST